MESFHTLVVPKASDDQILLWFQTVFLWMIANYTSADPTDRQNIARQKFDIRYAVCRRSLISAICSILLPGLTTAHWIQRLLLALVFLTFTCSLRWMRIRCASGSGKRACLAEVEIGTSLVFLLTSAVIIMLGRMHIYALVGLPLAARRVAFIFAVASAVPFLTGGGTRIVRGVLDDSGAAPELTDNVEPCGQLQIATPTRGVDTKEYNRGRLIGNIERLLLLIVVMAGKDDTLGLIIVAKGLIRSRQFENRDLAEYVIIGTLVSTLLAITVGLALGYTSTLLW